MVDYVNDDDDDVTDEEKSDDDDGVWENPPLPLFI
jgi:hypothetical protein